MSETFTIQAVGPPNDWESKQYKKRYKAYPLDLLDANGMAHSGVLSNRQLKDDGSHNEPTVGESVIGDIGPDKQGNDKLTLNYEAMKEAGGGGSTSGSGDYPAGGSKSGGWKPESKYDPEKVARIGRAHAQHMAILAAQTDRFESSSLPRDLKELVDWFEADVDAAAQKAVEGGLSGRARGSDSAGPPPQTPTPQVTHEEFHGLLERAGLNSNASRVVTDYALTNMSSEEQNPALEMLGSENRSGAAVKRLSEKTEAHYGSPLPTDDPDDDIPFARPEYGEVFSERERRSNR